MLWNTKAECVSKASDSRIQACGSVAGMSETPKNSKLTDAHLEPKAVVSGMTGELLSDIDELSVTPVSLLEALSRSFQINPGAIKKCLNSGDILVNGKPTDSKAQVTVEDKVLIVFGGPKICYTVLTPGRILGRSH